MEHTIKNTRLAYIFSLCLKSEDEVLTRRTLCSFNYSCTSFWYCNQNPSCNFFCSEDVSYLYEKALTAWKCTEQPQPRCEKHNKLAKMRIVKDLMKANYGRPFFVCADKSKPCSYWIWGDIKPIAKPECRHRFPCVIRKVKKEGIIKDRLFFFCPQENSCRYFECVPEKEKYGPFHSSDFMQPKPSSGKNEYLTNDFINDFANSLNIYIHTVTYER